MRFLPIFVLILFSIILTGCFSANPEDIEAFLEPRDADVTSDEYILQPPDSVTVIASRVPELQGTTRSIGHTQMVRPDGKISFESVGEIHVAGRTPKEVAQIISDKMVQLYNLQGDNPIDVRVMNRSKFYYVMGAVANPGAQIYTGRETTLSAISKAIPTQLAWEEAIQVIRPSLDPDQKAKIFELNYKNMIERGKMKGNVLLQEGDIIYVPPTILASIGLTVNEIVGPTLSGMSAVTNVYPAAAAEP